MCIKKDIEIIDMVNVTIGSMIARDVDYHEAKESLIAILCVMATKLSMQFNFRFFVEINNVNKTIVDLIDSAPDDTRKALIEFESSSWYDLYSQVSEYA